MFCHKESKINFAPTHTVQLRSISEWSRHVQVTAGANTISTTDSRPVHGTTCLCTQLHPVWRTVRGVCRLGLRTTAVCAGGINLFHYRLLQQLYISGYFPLLTSIRNSNKKKKSGRGFDSVSPEKLHRLGVVVVSVSRSAARPSTRTVHSKLSE